MKRIIILAASTCIAMLLASCKGPEVQGEKVGEYTQSLISDTTQNAYQIISLSRNKNIQGICPGCFHSVVKYWPSANVKYGFAV